MFFSFLNLEQLTFLLCASTLSNRGVNRFEDGSGGSIDDGCFVEVLPHRGDVVIFRGEVGRGVDRQGGVGAAVHWRGKQFGVTV